MARTRAQATPRRSPRIKRIQNQRLAYSRSAADRNGNVSNRETNSRNRRSRRLIDSSRGDPSLGVLNPIHRRPTAAERLASRLDLSREFYRGLVDRHQIGADGSNNYGVSQRQITNDAGTNVTISQLQTANVIDQREETDDEFRLDRTPRPIRSNRRSAIPQRMSLGAHHPNITNQPPLEQSWPNDEVRSDPSQFPFLSRNIRPRPTVSNGGARTVGAIRTALPRPSLGRIQSIAINNDGIATGIRHQVANQNHGAFVFRDPLRPAGSLSFHIHPTTVDLSTPSSAASNADPRIQFDADELQRLFWRDIFSLDILNLESRSLGMTAEQINSIQTKAFKSTRSSRHESCHVCLLDFENNELLKRLPKCGHEFHVDCLKPWLEKHTTCPVCRETVLKN